MNQLTETLSKDIENLRRARDELRVQLHLAKAEARDRFGALEEQWHVLETDLRRASAEATHKIVEQIREGYRDIKSSLV